MIRKLTEAEINNMVPRDTKTWTLKYKGKVIDVSADFGALHQKVSKFPHWKEEDWEVV